MTRYLTTAVFTVLVGASLSLLSPELAQLISRESVVSASDAPPPPRPVTTGEAMRPWPDEAPTTLRIINVAVSGGPVGPQWTPRPAADTRPVFVRVVDTPGETVPAAPAPAARPAAQASPVIAQPIVPAAAGAHVGEEKPTGPPPEVLPKPGPLTLPKAPTLPAPAAEFALPAACAAPAFELDSAPPAAGVATVSADAMLWIFPNRRTPAGVGVRGLIGSADSATIADTLGDEHLNRHILPGGRLAAGYWWTADDPWVPGGKLPLYGIESRFMFVGQRSASLRDDQSPTLVRPFFDVNNNQPSGVIVAAPGLATGGLVASANQSLWGIEANFWKNLHYDWPGTTCSIEGMVGMRYLNLDENILLGRASVFAANPVGFPDYAFLAGNRITERESFASHNRFFGGQVGVRGSMYFDKVILSGQFQVAAGSTNEQINIEGSQVRTLPSGQTITSPGALLALPSNIGSHDRNKFALVPEFGMKFAYPVNDHLTLGAGMTALYWSRIARASDQVDRAIDITQIPSFPKGGAVPAAFSRPVVPLNQSDLWLMGFLVSAEFKW